MLVIGLIDSYPVISIGIQILLQERFKESIMHIDQSFDDFDQKHAHEEVNLFVIGIHNKQESNWDQLIVQCRKAYPDAPIVMYSESLEVGVVNHALKHGVRGFILTEDILKEITQCTETVLGGRHYLNSEVEEDFFNQFFAGPSSSSSQVNTLSKRESLIAKYLTEGMRISSISKVLMLKPSTISTVKSKIFRKIGVSNVIELRDAMSSRSSGKVRH